MMRRRGLERRKSLYGLMFTIPWIVGVIPFFILPLVSTLFYSVSDVAVTERGLDFTLSGIKNYYGLFFEDASFIRELVEAIRAMLVDVILIVPFGIFFAIILNQEFRGRTVARAILFLPVIVTSGVVIYILQTDVNAAYAMGGVQGQSFIKMTAVNDILLGLGLPDKIAGFISDVMSSIFDMVWKCGVQVLLFLSALQSVPSSFYEAASVEGATSWEKFWKITFPMLTPYLLIGIVYTVIDSFTFYGNNLMLNAIKPAFNNFRYTYAAAMSFVYTLVVMLFLGLVFLLMGRRITYTEK